MPNAGPSGLACTVLGPVRPEELGPTTTHEHLLIDLTLFFKQPSTARERSRAYEPMTLQNRGWVAYDRTRSYENLHYEDEEVAASEALLFKEAGGKTIVDATTIGIGRDPLALARIARATGLNIVMGAGYYIDAVHPKGMDERTDLDIAREMVADLTTGVGDTGIRAGIIGELGCSWPITDNERKVLRAGARAQRETGAAILAHPGLSEAAPMAVLEVLGDAGADLSRVVMAHLDRTVSDMDAVLELARTGCYLEYDLFGWESSYYSLSDFDMPNDAQRIGFVKRLIDEGHAAQVLIAHDICGKNRLARYGGHGFSHILENIVPRMREKGVAERDIDSIIVENPARLLAFAPTGLCTGTDADMSPEPFGVTQDKLREGSGEGWPQLQPAPPQILHPYPTG
jgi:phosphotriesterase-related protein